MKSCSNCGTKNRNDAEHCNKCGSTQFGNGKKRSGEGQGCLYTLTFWPFELYFGLLKSHPKATIGVTIFFIVLSLISSYEHNKKVETEKMVITSDASYAKDQGTFVQLFSQAKEEISKADTDPKKELIKKNLKKEVLKLFSKGWQVTNWKGEIAEVKTSTDGDVGFKIRVMGSDAVFMNYDLIMTFTDPYRIKKSSKIFDKIASLSVGDSVNFSGRIINSKGEFEKSLDKTAKGLSSEDWKYLFELTDIEKIIPIQKE